MRFLPGFVARKMAKEPRFEIVFAIIAIIIMAIFICMIVSLLRK